MVIKRVVNLIDLGADPSGQRDCTEAFRQAISENAAVLVPAGTYRISGIIKAGPMKDEAEEVADLEEATAEENPES